MKATESMTHTPVDIFLKWLSDRPDHARVAVAIDGDRLLADAGILGKETAADRSGRVWRLVVFRGDDLAFRLAYRNARAEKHVLIVLARSMATQSRIDVSYVTDILSANEGGLPLDLSVPAVFRRLCPKINFPVTELRRFKDALLERLDAVPEAADKIVARWGRPDDWGRGQVAALVLLAQHPDWSLSDIWPDEIDPGVAVAHGLRVLLSVPPDSPDVPIVREMLQDAVYPQVKEHCFWFELPPEQVAGYLLIRAFVDDLKLQNPALQLAGLQVFPLELPLDKLEALSGKVIASMRPNAKTWRLVERRAEEFITPKRSEKLAALLPADATAKTIGTLTSPAMLFLYLRQCLRAFFADSKDGSLGWTAALASHPVLKADFGDQVGRRRQCLAAARLAQGIQEIESRLGASVPPFPNADGLLDWYVNTGHHRLELELARASHDLHACDDDEISKSGHAYLCGTGDETTPSQGSLGLRVRHRLDGLDATLAKFVQSDPAKLANDARSILGFLKSELDGELMPILSGDSDRRVWVLIFDGMRYDTWEDVVQPLLGEHFTISGDARFCVLPSYTLFARTSLLAGATASAWAANKAATSRDEAALFAKSIGLAAHEVKDKLRFVTDADTTKARTVLGFSDKTAKPVNVLIYPISDECHDYKGDLASFNSKIRQDMLGDRTTGIRGILDDLLRRVKPGDLVFATSDHGFIELPPDSAVVVSQAEAESHQATTASTVFYRYAKQFQPAGVSPAVVVEAGNDAHYLCVGRQWLKREGVGTPVRYSHGGLSLSEVVIPAFRLERSTEQFAAVELTGLPAVIAIDEDQDLAVSLGVRNKGNVELSYEVVIRTNLGDTVLTHSATLAPAAVHSLKCGVHGAFRLTAAGDVDTGGTVAALEIRLRHTDQAGKWRDAADGIVNVPVKVHAKKTKLATDALSGFDDV
jgi:hypothetical protein